MTNHLIHRGMDLLLLFIWVIIHYSNPAMHMVYILLCGVMPLFAKVNSGCKALRLCYMCVLVIFNMIALTIIEMIHNNSNESWTETAIKIGISTSILFLVAITSRFSTDRYYNCFYVMRDGFLLLCLSVYNLIMIIILHDGNHLLIVFTCVSVIMLLIISEDVLAMCSCPTMIGFQGIRNPVPNPAPMLSRTPMA